MKKIIFTILILSGITSFAQKKAFNQFSVEANYGLSLPVTPIPAPTQQPYNTQYYPRQASMANPYGVTALRH